MSGRALRSLSGPILRPIENRVVRSGGDPTHAGWWLVIGVAAAGVLALSLLDWVTVLMAQVAGAAGSGPRALLGLAIVLAYNVVFFALLARVIGSWLGMFQYSRWMRPAYAITNWLVEPIRRILPPAGAFDFSPLAAWLALWVLKQLLLSVI
jgi:YggT family protein